MLITTAITAVWMQDFGTYQPKTVKTLRYLYVQGGMITMQSFGTQFFLKKKKRQA